MSAQGVFTPHLRVEFVDGQETHAPDPGYVACGDGTRCPMLVTLDQIAEIWFRVKDAWFISGDQSWQMAGGGDYRYVFAPTTAAPNRSVQDDLTDYIKRGYTIVGADDYYGATYDDGNGQYCSDIGDNERGMWRSFNGITNAFSFYNGGDYSHPTSSEWITTTTDYLTDSTGMMEVVFTGRVAVVKTDPANGFFDPTNKFFIEMEMWWDDNNQVTAAFGGGTNILDGHWGAVDSENYVQVYNYVMRLSGGIDISCPIYSFTAAGDPESFSGSDWIHAAQEWWPYDRNATLRPIWESETGVFIPPGVPFLNMGDEDETLPFPIFF